MKKNNSITKNEIWRKEELDDLNYNAKEDIYEKLQNIGDVDTDLLMNSKHLDNRIAMRGMTTEALDVPGSELDDAMEDIGAEDEENNYYSLGLDNHNELQENEE